MLRNLSHDFARYVINTVGFQQTILKIAFESPRNKFY